MTTYGLPRQVITFLRHLEAYREFLRWEISEGSHKVTLTLCWNFRKRGSVHESIWTRLQRSLHVNSSPDAGLIPDHLSRLLVSSPRSSHRSASPFGRRLSWARLSSLSLPARWRRDQTSPGAGGRNSGAREHGSPPPASGSPSRLSLPVSPSRYSWHGMAHASTPSDTADAARAGTPVTSTPDSTVSADNASPGRVRISYRSEEDVARSMEDLDRRLHDENRRELDKIEKQWNEAIKNWPEAVLAADVNTSSDVTTETSDDNVDLEKVNDTVQKCLETCDNILDKHSTLIL